MSELALPGLMLPVNDIGGNRLEPVSVRAKHGQGSHALLVQRLQSLVVRF